MTLLAYIKDKRYFIIFYMVLMLFVSLIMFMNEDQNLARQNMLYTNIVCFFIVCIYIIIGYFYHYKFYQELKNSLHIQKDEIFLSLPKSKRYVQKLYLNQIEEVHVSYTKQLQKLHEEKLDHQDFIVSWIHEVKLPIAASYLLMENSTGKSVDYMVDKLEDEIQKMENYVQQALYYSRIDSFSKDYFISEVFLNQVIKESVKKYAKLFIGKKIHFEMNDKQIYVHSDSKWLSYVVDQIMVNALKYTMDNGQIYCYFEEDDKEKRVIIEDTGVGIKQEDLDRVFEKGFTSSVLRNQAKSTGMGLYLAKQMTRKLNHDITIESKEGRYTKAILHFPKYHTYRDLEI
ncbi:sensor histidine kinase [Shimazuella kribbensis]|uniref:sensor histidine kinase n=1 Tax=Shimazuella kribbensis TaxID=139808 RepID=UPI00040A603D|nr:sensor histidine kinase [Shimazuella kribbensis]